MVEVSLLCFPLMVVEIAARRTRGTIQAQERVVFLLVDLQLDRQRLIPWQVTAVPHEAVRRGRSPSAALLRLVQQVVDVLREEQFLFVGSDAAEPFAFPSPESGPSAFLPQARWARTRAAVPPRRRKIPTFIREQSPG